MLKFVNFLEAIIWLVKVQVNDVDLVVHRVSVVRPYSHLELVIFTGSKSNGVVIKVTLICIDLLSQSIFRELIYFIFNFLHLIARLRVVHHHLVRCMVSVLLPLLLRLLLLTILHCLLHHSLRWRHNV